MIFELVHDFAEAEPDDDKINAFLNVWNNQRLTNATLTAEVERLTRELEEMRFKKDWEKSGALGNEMLLREVEEERDTLQSKLDRVRELCDESFQLDNSNPKYGMVHAGKLAALLSDAAEMRKPETNYDSYVDDPMLGPM